MIKTICSERQIPRNSNTGFSWSLSIFDAIKCQTQDISRSFLDNPAALLYKHEVINRKWEGIPESSTSQVWMIDRVPFPNSGVKRLLDGSWLDDDVIDAYLKLCGYLRPDIKFLSTHWFPSLERWGQDASSKSVPWVSFPFHLHLHLTQIAAAAQISKHEANVEAAIRNFSTLITVINYPKNHWITLQFNPKEEILEVFDSMAPSRGEGRMEKLRKV
jgi:hypothetical protein